MGQLIYETFARFGGDRLAWRAAAKRLRILCYHGLCANELAGEPWIPPYFVGEGAFERQLAYLQRNARVLPLSEAVVQLRDGSLPPGAVSITFDDGYANNLALAYPLLRKYQMCATIFLSSAYMESGELFPFLKMRLISLRGLAKSADAPTYKSDPLNNVLAWSDRWWPEVEKTLTPDQVKTLAPLSVAEVRGADTQVIEFGAHSHTHCILKNETRERREEEIYTSVSKVAQWIGRAVTLFSYPNGERGDFSETDKRFLRDCGVEAAVSGIGGANNRRADLLELKRYPVGMHHEGAGFSAEVTGFRTAVLAASRRLGA